MALIWPMRRRIREGNATPSPGRHQAGAGVAPAMPRPAGSLINALAAASGDRQTHSTRARKHHSKNARTGVEKSDHTACDTWCEAAEAGMPRHYAGDLRLQAATRRGQHQPFYLGLENEQAEEEGTASSRPPRHSQQHRMVTLYRRILKTRRTRNLT